MSFNVMPKTKRKTRNAKRKIINNYAIEFSNYPNLQREGKY